MRCITLIALYTKLTTLLRFHSLMELDPLVCLTLNPYMSLCNLKLCTHIWSTNINFRSPLLTLNFLVCLGLNFHSMGEFGEAGGRLGLRQFFCHERTET